MMKVHLIRDYSVSYEYLLETKEIFDQIDGPIDFIYHQDSTNTIWELHSFGSQYVRIYEIYKKYQIKPELFFKTIQEARRKFEIPETEIVILLTAFNNIPKMFSIFENNNAFVFVREWDTYIDSKEIYPIAYQIIENVFKILCFEPNEDDSINFHKIPKACINDVITKKSEVIYKIHSGNICKDCLGIAQSKIKNDFILKQIIDILHLIRDQISGYASLNVNKAQQFRIRITADYNIIIEDLDKEIKLSPGEKTLYFFFLKYKEGVEFTKLSEHKDELLNLYKSFSKADNLNFILESTNKLVNPLDNAFHERISKIKGKFKKVISEEKARFYIPQKKRNDDAKYKINLKRDLISFPDNYDEII